jgi:hypothetical protein
MDDINISLCPGYESVEEFLPVSSLSRVSRGEVAAVRGEAPRTRTGRQTACAHHVPASRGGVLGSCSVPCLPLLGAGTLGPGGIGPGGRVSPSPTLTSVRVAGSPLASLRELYRWADCLCCPCVPLAELSTDAPAMNRYTNIILGQTCVPSAGRPPRKSPAREAVQERWAQGRAPPAAAAWYGTDRRIERERERSCSDCQSAISRASVVAAVSIG